MVRAANRPPDLEDLTAGVSASVREKNRASKGGTNVQSTSLKSRLYLVQLNPQIDYVAHATAITNAEPVGGATWRLRRLR
jgi:hypothetical protein